MAVIVFQASGAASPPVQPTTGTAWSVDLSHNPLPTAGCYVGTSTGTAWQQVQCVTAPSTPELPSTVGFGVDEVAQNLGALISNAQGSFVSVSGLTSESDNSLGPNYWALQVNSNQFDTTTTYTGGNLATGWEQFVYQNDPGTSQGKAYIQYWLIYYHLDYHNCPYNWWTYGDSCYRNSAAVSVPLQAITNLANLKLTGNANVNSLDTVTFCTSAQCYSVGATSGVLNLYESFHDAEFNVFGYGAGSTAQFNQGTTITVATNIGITPTCVEGGYTGEGNNLVLVGSCNLYGSGGIAFTETNAPIYYLSMKETNTGKGVCGGISPPSGWYVPNTVVNIQASWASGCTFKGWVGSGPGGIYTGLGIISGSNPYYSKAQVTMSGNVTETATFYCRTGCGQ